MNVRILSNVIGHFLDVPEKVAAFLKKERVAVPAPGRNSPEGHEKVRVIAAAAGRIVDAPKAAGEWMVNNRVALAHDSGLTATDSPSPPATNTPDTVKTVKASQTGKTMERTEAGEAIEKGEKPPVEAGEDVPPRPPWDLQVEPKAYLNRYGDDAANSAEAREVVAWDEKYGGES